MKFQLIFLAIIMTNLAFAYNLYREEAIIHDDEDYGTNKYKSKKAWSNCFEGSGY